MSIGMAWTKTRKAAIVFLVLPILVMVPFWYWVFHVAGDRYVSHWRNNQKVITDRGGLD